MCVELEAIEKKVSGANTSVHKETLVKRKIVPWIKEVLEFVQIGYNSFLQ